MDLFSSLLNIPILQALGAVLIVGLLDRMGVPVIGLFKSIFKMNGNGNGNGNYQAQIDVLNEHAKIANQEMGDIRDSISSIERDVSYIRGKMDK